ncbi:hypothetical protein YC2023_050829 [Brassica napus]
MQENTLNDMSPSSYHSVERSTDRLRKRHYIYSCKIPQPQPPGGQKRRILIRSKAHAAGNTSLREDNTLLIAVARFNAGTTRNASCWFQIPIRNHTSTISGSCWFGSQLQRRPLQPLDLMIPTRSSHHQHQYQWTIH